MNKFSLIIPVYRQEKVIKRDIDTIISALNTLNISYEIIAVIDGKVDRSWEEAEKIKDKRVKVVGYQNNHGKGYAVRFGFANATGDVIGFMDSGGDLKASALPLMIEQFNFQNADIVIGSKRHPQSKVNYPLFRKIQSFGYQQITRILFGLNVRDTQVGMKIYKRKILEEVLPRLLVKQFAFDIEILAVAYYLGYKRIYEAPVELNFDHVQSSITPKKLLNIYKNMLRDTLAVFYRLKILHYYDENNKRKWRFDPELNFRVNTG
jgi:glycosyltransferase involved in cell wall biosynthesis